MHRRDLVLVAFQQLLPTGYTMKERCDPDWLAKYPCGVQSLFTYATEVLACPDRMVELGEPLDPDEYEELLDALIVWAIAPMVAWQLGESPEFVLALFGDTDPENLAVLKAAAQRAELPLMDFLGAHRPTGPS